jgi:PAS domain-containing protein
VSDAFDVTQLALLGEAADCLEDVAVFVWDEDRNYVAANRAASDLVGHPRNELLKARVGELSPASVDDVFDEVQRRGVHTGTMQSPTGEIHYLTCKTRIGGLPYFVSVCWRVT